MCKTTIVRLHVAVSKWVYRPQAKLNLPDVAVRHRKRSAGTCLELLPFAPAFCSGYVVAHV
jgi:hypothetical protein